MSPGGLISKLHSRKLLKINSQISSLVRSSRVVAPADFNYRFGGLVFFFFFSLPPRYQGNWRLLVFAASLALFFVEPRRSNSILGLKGDDSRLSGVITLQNSGAFTLSPMKSLAQPREEFSFLLPLTLVSHGEGGIL